MEYVYIGKIVDTHGIKGELRIRSNFERKEKVFKPNMIFYIGDNYIPETVNTYRPHKEFDMVSFSSYNNINEVLKYLKQKVYVKRSDLELNPNDYLLQDLIGFDVVENETILGKVSEIMYNNGNDLLCVTGKNNFYIPLKGDFIKKVNVNEGIIEVENTKGLII